MLQSFQKDKILSLDGLPVEFYSTCFECLGEDLFKTMEYSRTLGQMLVAFNTNFISPIPKFDNPSSFDLFRPISNYNNIYKIIAKLIASHLKDTLAENISSKQFGFLHGKKFHQAIGLAQEGVHSIHTGKQRDIALKVYLLKDFD